VLKKRFMGGFYPAEGTDAVGAEGQALMWGAVQISSS
jgi:hypothetical protein